MFTGTGTSTRPGILVDTTGTGTGYGTGTWYQVRTGICSATTTRYCCTGTGLFRRILVVDGVVWCGVEIELLGYCTN
jgi:hypothetical protein